MPIKSCAYHTYIRQVKFLIAFCTLSIVGACASDPVTKHGPDTTPPELAQIEVHFPRNIPDINPPSTTLTVKNGSTPVTIQVQPGDSISLLFSGRDEQGLKDIQLFMSSKSCTESGGVGNCSQPLSLDKPVASLPDTGGPNEPAYRFRGTAYAVEVPRDLGSSNTDSMLRRSIFPIVKQYHRR
jgi:hypothetical protein